MKTEWHCTYKTRTRIYTITGYYGSSKLKYNWRKI